MNLDKTRFCPNLWPFLSEIGQKLVWTWFVTQSTLPDYTLDNEEELEGALEVLLLPFISFITFIELICIVFAISYDFIYSNDPVMV